VNRQSLLVVAGVAVLLVAGVGSVALAAGVVDLDDGPTTAPATDGTATAAEDRRVVEPTTSVAIRAPNGTERATVRVAVADTEVERYEGLSGTAPLDDGEGLLFVHENEETHAYVMRGMRYPLDIVFVADDGTVTRIHHASLPPAGTSGGDLTRYRGYGRFVLEVPRGYTNRTGIAPGDRVRVPERYR
jgi:uncharacterized membrane protein (UPF0127 family)